MASCETVGLAYILFTLCILQSGSLSSDLATEGCTDSCAEAESLSSDLATEACTDSCAEADVDNTDDASLFQIMPVQVKTLSKQQESNATMIYDCLSDCVSGPSGFHQCTQACGDEAWSCIVACAQIGFTCANSCLPPTSPLESDLAFAEASEETSSSAKVKELANVASTNPGTNTLDWADAQLQSCDKRYFECARDAGKACEKQAHTCITDCIMELLAE